MRSWSCTVGPALQTSAPPPDEAFACPSASHAVQFHQRTHFRTTGTDTMAYTACALSLLLAGFRKPIILTGSQLPLTQARSDARQNLVDSLTGTPPCDTVYLRC